MQIIQLFAVVGIAIFIGFASDWVFKKTSIPDVLWLMIFGVLIEHIFRISQNDSFRAIGPIFTTFALIFILFESSISVGLKKLYRNIIGSSRLSFTFFLLSVAITATAMLASGWSLLEGLLLGSILGGTSSGMIVPLINKISISKDSGMVLTFESAINDVFTITGAVSILNIMVLKSFSSRDILQTIIFSFAGGVFIGAAACLLWITLQKIMDKFSRSYITTIAAIILTYSISDSIGASGAIACLTFGIVYGNSKIIMRLFSNETWNTLSESKKFFYSEISFVLKVFFFVYLGIIVDLSNPAPLLFGFMITVLLLLVRPLAVSLSCKIKHEKDKAFMEILIPKGQAAAVLAQLPSQYNIPGGEIFSSIVVGVIWSSIILSLVFVYLIETGRIKSLKSILDLSPLFRMKIKG